MNSKPNTYWMIFFYKTIETTTYYIDLDKPELMS